jgi:hypothetical protein
LIQPEVSIGEHLQTVVSQRAQACSIERHIDGALRKSRTARGKEKKEKEEDAWTHV